MDKKELVIVSKLPANRRYEYFIKKVVDYEEVWGLFDNGWVTTEDDAGRSLIPFWPKKEFAQLCAIDEWSKCIAKSIELDEFIDNWLPGMEKDGVIASIFWNNYDSAVLEINTILRDLELELEKYE